MGKMAGRMDAAGREETFCYDVEGRLSRHTDRNGNQTTFAYNMYHMSMEHLEITGSVKNRQQTALDIRDSSMIQLQGSII